MVGVDVRVEIVVTPVRPYGKLSHPEPLDRGRPPAAHAPVCRMDPIVGIDLDGRLLVGAAAKELQVVRPDRCAALFKRHMGSEALKADAHVGTPVTRAV